MDAATWGLIGVILGLLAAATAVGEMLKRQPESGLNRAALTAFNGRVRSWWLLCCLLAAAFWFYKAVTVALFGLIAFWALREFITLTPTRLGDHRALFWVFFIVTPLQFLLVALDVYELYSILIPVYAFLFILARVAIAGDYKRYLERVAKIQAGMLVCIYCLSYAPAVLYLDLVDYQNQPWQSPNAALLFYFVVMVQLSDVFHFAWDKLFGRHLVAPMISGSRTWEGFFGGSATVMIVGMALAWATPFGPLWSGGMSLLIAFMAFSGSLTMSAIKRDRGVADYGTLVTGHGGVLDRMDSICFSAPVFYHLTKYFFSGA